MYFKKLLVIYLVLTFFEDRLSSKNCARTRGLKKGILTNSIFYQDYCGIAFNSQLQYILSAYYKLGTALGNGNKTVNK